MANRNVQVGYVALRSNVTTDDTALAAATYDSLPTNKVNFSGDATSLKLIAFGKGTVNGTALVNIFGGHGQTPQQPAILLGGFTFTLGTMQCNNNPTAPLLPALTTYFYFDTVAETVAGGVADLRIGNDSGNNRIGMGIVRLTGESWIYAEVQTLTTIDNFYLMANWVNETIPET